MPLSSNLSKPKIPRIDGLRAISALLVLLYHYGYTFIPAGFGVMIFFVISGFLITWLLLKEHDTTQTVSLKKFYVRRCLRILPAFYFYWLIAIFLLIVSKSHILWPQAISSLFYVSNYYQGLHHYPSTLFSLTWSLSIEEQFYLFWPAAFTFVARRNPKWVLRMLALTILAVWLYRLALWSAGVPEEYIYTAFDTRVDHLLVGCSLAIGLYHGILDSLIKVLTARISYIVPTVGLLIISIVLAGKYGVDYRNTVAFAIDPILIAVLIIQLLSTDGHLVTWLDSKPMTYLGRISYSTYLWHSLAMLGTLRLASRMGIPHWTSLPVSIFAAWALAAASYQMIEKPFLNLKGRFTADRREVMDSSTQQRPDLNLSASSGV